MIEKFRKKPIEIDMMLWDGTPERLEQIKRWVPPRVGSDGVTLTLPSVLFNETSGLRIWNEQEHQYIEIPLGHRVAKGALGEFYPVSPAAIAETFEPVSR